MATVKAFRGIFPREGIAADFTLDLENLTYSNVKTLAKEKSPSFAKLLVPPVDKKAPKHLRKGISFKLIDESFKAFLDEGILIEDKGDSFYYIEIQNDSRTFRGIWTLTSVQDYLDGAIKRHEAVDLRREMGLVDYISNSGIDANPVLLVYPRSELLIDLSKKVALNSPFLAFLKGGLEYKLWRFPAALESELVSAFKDIGNCYVGDGHHRLEAVKENSLKIRKTLFFNSVYISSPDIEILGFNRLIKSEMNISIDLMMTKLEANFRLSHRNSLVIPARKGSFGVYYKKHCYELECSAENSNLDVNILHYEILSILFGRDTYEIEYMSQKIPVEEQIEKAEDSKNGLLFFLFPVTVTELIKVADSGNLMPPKSTYVLPKFLSGLLINRI